MHPNSVAKTCTVTPFGSFVWDYLPFGLRNSAQCFQRHINHITSDLDFVVVYLDDVLVFSPDDETYLLHLRKLFERFSKYSLTINLQKCKFGVNSIDYLGHHIDSSGITPLSKKLTAIQNFPKPSNMRQLRRFVRMIAFYKKFIPKCAEIMRPIYALLSPQHYSKKVVLWNDEAEKAFHEIIAKISSPDTLAYPVKNAPTYLVTDASEIAAGTVLHQKINGDLRPLGFLVERLLMRSLMDPVHDPEWTQSRMDTIPNGHNPEWTQSRMDTIPNGHNPEWTQSRMDTIPNGHHPEWTQSRMDTIPNGHNPEWHNPQWAQSRMDTIPNGHHPEWTQSRMDTIPNGHNPEWTQSRMDTIPKGHHPEWTQSRMDTIPNGHNPERTPSRMDTIPNGHNPEWTPSRLDTIPNGHHPEWTPSRMDTIPNGHHPEWTQSRIYTIPKGRNPE